VTAQVNAVRKSEELGGLELPGKAHEWRFEVRRDEDGWRIWDADPATWCGMHVTVLGCRPK
jgi:hypothetical protein